MDNVITEEKNVMLEVVEEHVNESVPIVIEKQPRKKRTTHSEAQLETLRRGRERLA